MKITKRALPMAMLAGLMTLSAPSIAGTSQPGNTANSPKNSQKNAQKLSTVVVTGSHIRRVQLETANPVLTVSHQEITATGDMTLGKLVQDLPVMTGGRRISSMRTTMVALTSACAAWVPRAR